MYTNDPALGSALGSKSWSESAVVGRFVDLRLYAAWFGLRLNVAGGELGGVPPGVVGAVRVPEPDDDEAWCALYNFCGGATPKT